MPSTNSTQSCLFGVITMCEVERFIHPFCGELLTRMSCLVNAWTGWNIVLSRSSRHKYLRTFSTIRATHTHTHSFEDKGKPFKPHDRSGFAEQNIYWTQPPFEEISSKVGIIFGCAEIAIVVDKTGFRKILLY